MSKLIIVLFMMNSLLFSVEVDQKQKMKENMNEYFLYEKNEALFFMGFGLVTTLGGGLLLSSESDYQKGLGAPLLGIGLIQLTVGSTVFFRTDNQVANLEKELFSKPDKYKTNELKRMEVVNYWFKVYKIIEYSFILAGAGLYAYGASSDNDFAKGFGTGLVIQSAIMLGLDYLAESRAHEYTKHLKEFQFEVIPEGQNKQNETGLYKDLFRKNLGNEGYYSLAYKINLWNEKLSSR